VRDLPTLLRDGDLLVVNDTKVIPARLRLRRETGGAAEVLLLEPLGDDRRTWEAMIRPARKLRVGERLFDADGCAMVEIGGRTSAGDTWNVTSLPMAIRLLCCSVMARCPCLRTSPPSSRNQIATRRSTPRAASSAAPTAGLHFTPIADSVGEKWS
jgi:S-adenosylmethionine:tRNA ribosyltransferase-isomerase